MLAIKTRNLTKRYDSFLALDKLNLNVRKGEVYGFIGRNGAGKTTTINLLLSLINKDEGEIFVNDKKINYNDVSYKRIIGYVPDVPIFPGYMNAREYISYTLDMFDYQGKNRKQKTDELLTFVGLNNHNKKISTYSRGMKQRLAIAQALVHNPEILIMDEPTSALDPIGRKEVIDIILKLKGEKTIFYSTHILEDVEKVCNRIGIIDEGKLLLEDSISNIQQKYYRNELELTTNNKEIAISILKKIYPNNDFILKGNAICFSGDNIDVNEVLNTLISYKLKILELKRSNATLEDVFLRVTNEKVT